MGTSWGYDWGNNWGGGWRVIESKKLKKKLARRKGGLPKSVTDQYDVWKAIIRNEGMETIKRDNSYNHKNLKGEKHGLCSSRLTKQHRVIYAMDEQNRKISVEDVDSHDKVYRQRR